MRENEGRADVRLAAKAIGLESKGAYTNYGRKYFKAERNGITTPCYGGDFRTLMKLTKNGIMRMAGAGHRTVTFRLTRYGMTWLEKQLGILISGFDLERS